MALSKTTPIESQRAVLGSILLRPELLPRARAIIGDSPTVFSDDRMGRIWLAILRMADRGDAVGEWEVYEALDREIPALFISDLTAACPDSRRVEHYARILTEGPAT